MKPVDKYEVIPPIRDSQYIVWHNFRGILSVPFEQMKFDADGIKAHVPVPLLQAGLKNHLSHFIVLREYPRLLRFSRL